MKIHAATYTFAPALSAKAPYPGRAASPRQPGLVTLCLASPPTAREPRPAARSKQVTMDRKLKRKAGLTLTELLCVITILLILAALYLPAIARAYSRIRAFVADLTG